MSALILVDRLPLHRWRPFAASAMAATVIAMVAAAGAWATGYAPPITRLAGADRYATSAAAAATYASPQTTVYVASGGGYADALSAAPLAGAQGAPLLLVAPTSIPAAIHAQLVRLQPTTIVVLGGPGVVSDAVLTQLQALTTPAGGAARVYGNDRYATSAAVLHTYPTPGSTTPRIYVVAGTDYPDGLSAAALAGHQGAPLALVQQSAVPPLVLTELQRLKPASIVVLGGSAVVSDAVLAQLDGLTTPAGGASRIAGADRYKTSALISQAGYPSLPPASVVYVATGTGFADALSGAPLAAKDGVPLLLVQPAALPAAIGTELTRLDARSMVVLGGDASVGGRVLLAMSDDLDPNAPLPGACSVYPADNVWNVPVDGLPVAADSADMIAKIGLTSHLHADFDAVGDGIPYNIVAPSTPTSTVSFTYSSESDHVAYPIPPNPVIEGGSDRHLLMVDPAACRLWELFAASKSGSTWHAGSGATWDLTSNALRPAGWTSADAAGLPIFAGLARYDELASGAILHALRFTASSTCAGYIYPAEHQAGSGTCSATSDPPMGLRVRLKASVDISAFGPQAQVVLTALKTYGMILADNGSPWYVSGAPDSRWDDDDLHQLQTLHGSDFEVVDTSGLVNGP
ncbi:MAG TPA: cell wall-binding repeat-containing protein [Candidatus Limnocylindrales bacterium]